MSVDSLSLFQKLIPKPDFSGDAKMFYSNLYSMYLIIQGVDFFYAKTMGCLVFSNEE